MPRLLEVYIYVMVYHQEMGPYSFGCDLGATLAAGENREVALAPVKIVQS